MTGWSLRRVTCGLRTALSLLTAVPMGDFECDHSAAVGWYPWVGWLFGGVGVLIARGFARYEPGPLGLMLAGLFVVVAWAALSRLLHYDGVADSADGILGTHTRERRLEVMRDSRIGAFGTLALVVVVAAQVLGIALCIEGAHWWAIGLAPVTGRAIASATILTARPARTEGFGASVATHGALTALWAAAGLVLAIALLPPSSFPALGWALFAGTVASLSLARALGGYTGDTLGAGIALGETAVLLAGALVTLA